MALSLYEREVGPILDKVSYTGKGFVKMEEVNHTHCFSGCSPSLVFLKNCLPSGSFCFFSLPFFTQQNGIQLREIACKLP